jgi:hypothetical protein
MGKWLLVSTVTSIGSPPLTCRKKPLALLVVVPPKLMDGDALLNAVRAQVSAQAAPPGAEPSSMILMGDIFTAKAANRFIESSLSYQLGKVSPALENDVLAYQIGRRLQYFVTSKRVT